MINVQAVHAHASQYINRVRPYVESAAMASRRRGRGQQQGQQGYEPPEPTLRADPIKRARMHEMVEAARRLEAEATYRSNLPIENRGK